MAIFAKHAFDPTAFMSGQIGSKVWLCEHLEPLFCNDWNRIWLLGGWYGVTNFLLHTRQVLPIEKVVSFDLNPEATLGARIFNEASIHQGKFEAHTWDVNELDYSGWGGPPDLVINTSTEHIEDHVWFDLIPEGTAVALQSNDMPHEDHVHSMSSPEDLLAEFPLSTVLYKGTKHFQYPDWSFNRFMIIGYK